MLVKVHFKLMTDEELLVPWDFHPLSKTGVCSLIFSKGSVVGTHNNEFC